MNTDHSYHKGLVLTRWHTSPNQRRSARWRLHRRAVNATCWNYAWCIVIDVCFSEKWRHVRKKYTKRMRRKSKKNTHKMNPTKILTKIHKTNVTKFEKKPYRNFRWFCYIRFVKTQFLIFGTFVLNKKCFSDFRYFRFL